MKRKYLLALTLSVLTVGTTYAQGEMDAYKFSRNELRGTARSVAMGGAFGALGGDPSGVAINPAGIGIYTKSEISTTLNLQNVNSETSIGGMSTKNGKFKPTIDNFSAIGTLPLGSDDVPLLNIGFSYNRLKSFDRKVSTGSFSSPGGSMADYMAYRAGDRKTNQLSLQDNPDAWRNTDWWLPVLGYNSWLIDQDVNGHYYSAFDNGTSRLSSAQSLQMREKGSINSYDFNIGANISNIVSVGFTLGVTDIDYKLYSLYAEDYNDGGASGGYDLINNLHTEGTGIQFKLGAILKPIEEFRIGIAYHSPTWYNMSDFYRAALVHELDDMVGRPSNTIGGDYAEGAVLSNFYEGDAYHYDTRTDYEFQTPDKWTFSLAGVLDQKLILSGDVELTNYKSMKLYDEDGRTLSYNPNQSIKDNFKMSTTLRLGAEYRILPQFSARAGYSWVQSPISKELVDNKKEVMTVGTISHYTIDGDTNYVTWGFGYRFSPAFYADLAFVVASQKDKLYMFPDVYVDEPNYMVDIMPEKIDLKTNKFQGLLTLGYRF